MFAVKKNQRGKRQVIVRALTRAWLASMNDQLSRLQLYFLNKWPVEKAIVGTMGELELEVQSSCQPLSRSIAATYCLFAAGVV
jgi:hypothetical protein